MPSHRGIFSHLQFPNTVIICNKSCFCVATVIFWWIKSAVRTVIKVISLWNASNKYITRHCVIVITFKNIIYAHRNYAHRIITAINCDLCRRGAVVKGVGTYFDNCVSQHLSGAGSSPAGSVGRDLNLQKLNYQYLTTSVAVVLVVRWYFND